MPARNSGGRAPFGFRWNGGSLAVDEEKAAVRRLIFDLFLEHQSKGAVAAALNQMGYPSPAAGKWTDVTVSRLLRCPSAVGTYDTYRGKVEPEGEEVEGTPESRRAIPCPPLVKQEIWETVQRLLSEQASGESKVISRRSHTLSGMVQCVCGENMTIPSSLSKFTCAKCGNKAPAADLESIFLRDLAQFEEEHREAVHELLQADPRDDDLFQELAFLREERRKAESQIAKAQKSVLEGKFSAADFTALTKPLEAALRSLRPKIRKAESKIQERREDRPVASSQETASFVTTLWPRLPLKTRQRIARTFVERFVASPGKLVIHHRFPLQTAAVAQHMEDPTDDIPDPDITPGEPVYIRLPKPGQVCSLSGLTRSMLNELILPTLRNLHQPPVKSITQCQPGKGRGVRLIIWASLKSHLLRLRKEQSC